MTEPIKEDAKVLYSGVVIYADAGVKPNPGLGGWGLHGYMYNEEKPKKGSGCQKAYVTKDGYLMKENFKGKDKPTEITPIRYLDAYGSISASIDNNAAEDTTDPSLLLQDDQATALSTPSPWPFPGHPSSLDPLSSLCCYYPLDAASLLPVELLDVQSHHKVMDLCAAPGGKSLAILQRLNLTGPMLMQKSATSSVASTVGMGMLYCNDISPERRIRLKTVIRRYLPRAMVEKGVQVVGYDVTSRRFSDDFTDNSFDRVLLVS